MAWWRMFVVSSGFMLLLLLKIKVSAFKLGNLAKCIYVVGNFLFRFPVKLLKPVIALVELLAAFKLIEDKLVFFLAVSLKPF